MKEWFSVSGGVSVLGVGGSAGRTKSLAVQRGEISAAGLREYLHELLERVRRLGFVGAILHFNNLELLARRDPGGLALFFEEVRDVLPPTSTSSSSATRECSSRSSCRKNGCAAFSLVAQFICRP